MNYYREYQNTDAFSKYHETLVNYINTLSEDALLSLFNELMREIRYPEIYRMNEIDDIFYGLSFTEALDQIDKDGFNLSDNYIRFDDTYACWESYDNIYDAGGFDIDPDFMAGELLNLDISRYTEIQDEYILSVITSCEEEAGEEIQKRRDLEQAVNSN